MVEQKRKEHMNVQWPLDLKKHRVCPHVYNDVLLADAAVVHKRNRTIQ